MKWLICLFLIWHVEIITGVLKPPAGNYVAWVEKYQDGCTPEKMLEKRLKKLNPTHFKVLVNGEYYTLIWATDMRQATPTIY